MGCFVIFLVIFGYVGKEIVFLKGVVKFREVKKVDGHHRTNRQLISTQKHPRGNHLSVGVPKIISVLS